jgi:23S rRNA (guanosine2251-2'-O)-methyltransferase
MPERATITSLAWRVPPGDGQWGEGMSASRLRGVIPIVSILWMIMATARLSTGLVSFRNVVCRYPKPSCVQQFPKPFDLSQKAVHHLNGRIFSTSSDDNRDQKGQRLEALHVELRKLNINATKLQDANLQAVQNPTAGYDGRYGRSAIRAYRSFVEPKKADSNFDLSVLAARCARQIDFLVKRHKSHEAEWVRHSDAASQQGRTFSLIILLDNVRSAFNVGSLFRTADACGCCQVITTGITPHPGGSGSDKLAKSALGADKIVSCRHFDTTLQAIQTLRMEGYKLIGVETTQRSVCYTDAHYPQEGTALILGNEVTGVDTEVLPLLDEIVEIPMFGNKNSLNIAACAPVVLYEVLRQWKVLDRD